MNETYALVAAVFSALATALAAFATWRSPLAAAKLAETMRRDAELANRRYDKKMELFTTLMQERAAIYSDSGVRALNLIDVVFNESPEVREAWGKLFLAFDSNTNTPPTEQHECLLQLLAVMAKDIGLTGQLSTDDLGRIYFPAAISEERFIRDFHRRMTFQQILVNQALPAANAAAQQGALWPPKPD